MKYRLLLALTGVLWACNSASGGGNATIVGAHDLILMDQLPGDGTVANFFADGGGTGITNQFLFITSTDTNELRVLQMSLAGQSAHHWVRAPNPLESLSIPVVDRPQILAGDEGFTGYSDAGVLRVTGAYVYAAAVGGSQISVVDADPTALIQITPSPLTIGVPITAMVGWMGANLTTLPATTTLYYATFDGDVGSLWALKFPMAGADRATRIAAAQPTALLDLPRETIVTMKMVPPIPERTFNGQPFCATSACMAIATRSNSGAQGRTLLVEVDTLRSAPLGFPGPVRELAVAPNYGLIYGVLDEEKCDNVTCGGVIGIDSNTGSSPAGFPLLTDFTGHPMPPLTANSLPRGLVLGEGADISLPYLAVDGGGVYGGTSSYNLLGMFSNSAGNLVPFDALAGIPLDYDPRRPAFLAAQLAIPGPTADGGYAFFNDDGGATTFQTIGASISGTALNGSHPFDPNYSTQLNYDGTLFDYEVHADGGVDVPLPDGGLCTISQGDDISIQIADGYFQSQFMRATYQGVLLGFDTLTTSASDGTRLKFSAGLEQRLQVGDRVLFGSLEADAGVDACGETTVTGYGSGYLDVASVPPECASRVAYTVRAAGAQPIVLNGASEGYMGRGAEGRPITYIKHFVVQPSNPLNLPLVTTSLVLTVNTACPIPGAYWDLYLNGHLSPYLVTFDTGLCSSTPNYVPGKLVMAPIPQYENVTSTLYFWKTFTMYPAVNGVMEGQNSLDIDNGTGLVSTASGAFCWR